MLADQGGKRKTEYVPDYVVFDLETTGTSCRSDEVVEISAVKVKNGEVVEEFSTLVNPGRPIPLYASQVNGITDDMVKDSPFFDTALSDFIGFIGEEVLVGHNIHSFDMKFIQRDAEKYFGKLIDNDYVDTLQLSRMYLPEMSHHTLMDLACHYGIDTVGAHRALNDCHMNQQVYERLHEEMEHPSEAVKAVKKCPKCGNLLKKRSGMYGTFWGCMSYPECRYTENIK